MRSPVWRGRPGGWVDPMRLRWFAGLLAALLTATTVGVAHSQPTRQAEPQDPPRHVTCEFIPTPENRSR